MQATDEIQGWRDKLGVSVPAAAKILDVSRWTARRLVRDRKLESFVIGKSVRVRVSSLLALIEPEQKAA